MELTNCGAETKAATNVLDGIIELRGQVECDPTVLAEGETATACRFKSDRGEVYTLVSNRLSEALFADTNLHRKKLVVHGRVDTNARTLEITGNLRSLIGGKLHELFYYCDICSIKGIEFGPCVCCREPVFLVEEPVSETARGKIAGRVLFRGTVPRAEIVDDTGAHRPLLEVDGKTSGLKHVVAYLESTRPLRSASPPPLKTTNPPTIDQLDHTFVPHVLAIRSGQEVRFTNSDSANHNVRASSSVRSNEFNVFTGTGGSYKHRFVANSNAAPAQLGCDIHPWMRGWIFPFDHAFFATTSADGTFEIDAVPEGDHTLVLRQPDVGYLTRRPIRVRAGDTSRVEIEITEAELRRR